MGADAALHRTALTLAQQILLVASADLIGLWHTRVTLGLLHNQLALGPDRLALLVNRHDRRYHHDRAEIEWALGLPLAAIVPNDHRSVQRALAAQHPLILEGRSRAGRALVDFSERVHGGSILLPAEVKTERRGCQQRWPRRRSVERTPSTRPGDQGLGDGEYVTPVS
ncbi:MAG: hypothetical protein ACR2JC_15955 [Chloroflexota bacterium]